MSNLLSISRRTLFVILYVGIAVILVVTTFTYLLRDNLNQLADRGELHLRQAGERLVGQVAPYKILANTITDHPDVIEVLYSQEADGRVRELLLDRALLSGAALVMVSNQIGEVVASSDPTLSYRLSQKTFFGAMNGSLMRQFGYLDTGQRYLSFSRGIIDGSGAPVGVVTVVADLALLEFDWVIDDRIVLFTSKTGEVLSSNRPALIGNFFDKELGATQSPNSVATYRRDVFKHSIWLINERLYDRQYAIAKASFNPVLDFQVVSLQQIRPAIRNSLIEAVLLALLLTVIGFWLVLLNAHRQALSDSLDVEAKLTQELEGRVERRTEALRSTQAQLIAAGKLNALGELAAGITHELNQPLAAIKNFAENGQKFVARGMIDKASENLGLVSAQIDRISVIIRSLRAFAQKEKVSVEPVRLSNIVSESINLSALQLKKAGVRLQAPSIERDWIVQGGEIRLQQVFVNLILNAIEAMSDQTKDKLIQVTAHRSDDHITISVRDTGPGVGEIARVFEPFYTTKARGGSKGLGLGLSISHGIVASFDGELSCENHKEGGAVFHVKLRRHSEADT